MNTELVDEARRRAEAGLLANGGALGLLGSNEAYLQIWARDSMICSLGLLLCQDKQGAAVHRRSLQTLRAHQSSRGKIPRNVGVPNAQDPALLAHAQALNLGGKGLVTNHIAGNTDVMSPAGNGGVPADLHALAEADTAHAGCVDGNLWYILGRHAAFVGDNDHGFLRESWPGLQQALLWLRYQDSNEAVTQERVPMFSTDDGWEL